jgi:hypothetical protein
MKMVTRDDDVIYRKGMTSTELSKAKENTTREHVRSHANEGAFAGFMLLIIIGRYAFHLYSWQSAAVVGGFGAAFGFLVGHGEASVREKRMRTRSHTAK